MDTIAAINLWLRHNGFEGVVSLLILVVVLAGASSVAQWLWSEHRWYLYLCGICVAILVPWMAWDLKKRDEGPR